jgi:threonine dehydratase
VSGLAVSLQDIVAARARLAGAVLRTPLVPLDGTGVSDVWLKLETLQPIGSFKTRGAGNAILAAGGAARAGVATVSAGNMAQGVAWWARRLGLPATAVVPAGAPETKLQAIRRLGARVIEVPFDRWWAIIEGKEPAPVAGHFVHPVADAAVIAGNGTIGLEIVEDLPEVDTILVPFGGGGLSCGIAAAVRSTRPSIRVIGCEVETAAPLAASLSAGAPRSVPWTRSFVEGIGGKSLLPAMWPLVRELLAGAAVSSVASIAAAIRLLAERARIVAEGAGAASVAAALGGHARGRTVCVVSGGNIDTGVLVEILAGGTPA